MSDLVLIRHGQASFGAPDYDVLSERGIEQSRCLGRHLAASGERFDAVYAGPRRRHADTARHAAEAASAAGHELPEPAFLEDLDELPAFELVKHWRPIISEREPELAQRIIAGSTKAMAHILDRWADGSLDSGEHESYAAFESRVRGAIDTIRAREGQKRRILVFTSGGPVALTVGYALGLTPSLAMSLIWPLANSSVTHLRYRTDALGLVAYNRISHLADAALVTTR